MGTIDDIRNVLQDFMAPELRELRGRFDGVNARLDAHEKVSEAQNVGIGGQFAGMTAQFAAVNLKIDALSARLESIASSLSWEQRLSRLEAARPQQQ